MLYIEVLFKSGEGRRFIKEETENQLTEWKEAEKGAFTLSIFKSFSGMVYFYNVLTDCINML